MPNDLHPSAVKVLCYIADYFNEHSFAPTQEETKAACGSWAGTHVLRLERGGYLERNPRQHRGLKVTKKGLKVIAKQKGKS